MRHLLSLKDLSKKEILSLVDKGIAIKKNPNKYSTKLKSKTLLMLFEKPSLRTRVSFETGMTQLGGHGIFYSIADSPLGKKESLEDTSKTASRYVDIIMARLFKHEDIISLADNSSVPVINALTNFEHPCQVLGDFMTIKEQFKRLENLKIAYVGDGNNNVTHSLMYGCAKLGIDLNIGCPKELMPQQKVISETKAKIIIHDAYSAVRDADVVYTDSWMSYHIPDSEKHRRFQLLRPFQVNASLMSKAKKSAIFMHCLPATRGDEVTADIIDGKQSIVFDQAENRLHIQKAIMIWLLSK